MKVPRYEATKVSKMEKSCAAVADTETTAHCLKASPVKQPSPIKPLCPPAEVSSALFALKSDISAVHNKENSRDHDRTLEDGFEDSGYLSLHNSQIDLHHEDEEDVHHMGKPVHREKTPNNSPSKNASRPVTWLVVSAPVDCPKKPASLSMSSTPHEHHSDLPLLKFQRSVCEKLAESYRKNRRYDWSIVSKVAEDHLLDRVIGGHMGLEYVDIFTSLLSRNMRSILANILARLDDMDLLNCKKVSKSWRKIISEDSAVLSRCQRAEQALRESKSSLRHSSCGLTRDVTMSRAVLSCMQTLASSKSSSSLSTVSCRTTRQSVSKSGSFPTPQCTRFNEYIQAASNLKQHESLRPCKRCGSPATHLPEVQRATCTRHSCLFDFCTRCQEGFHGSTPCRTVQPRSHCSSSSFKTTPIIPGSARSKRSVRRL